ncbi:hypothetical protein DWU98_06410 [Dyella monticola]|uniref:Flagellar FliJ protein n=1 Tax=Dyella monticola TaxID=1927958 RepID=A0A370X3C2_9GAMM|nr:hypothetical protein [Dyella monticola]RDS82780.1 hypothetical protein DWU98_06410 [Dyella monticola]
MQRAQILAIARSELSTIATIRCRRIDAQVQKLTSCLQDTQQQIELLSDKVSHIEQEMQAVRTACMEIISGRPGSIHIYRNMLRAMDVELHRTHAQADAKREQCQSIALELSKAKEKLSAMEERLDAYAKIERRASAILAENWYEIDH